MMCALHSRRARALGTLLLGLVLWLGASSTALAARPAPWAEGGTSQPQDLVISLATFGPGSDPASWFGHTAIAVEDRRINFKRIYNYGMFSMDADVVPMYVQGRLEFWVAPTPFDGTLRSYAAQDRDVRLLELNLPAPKRKVIAEFLENNILVENRSYLYHHYDDNCATRIRDLIDLGTDGQFGEMAKSTPARYTLRGHTRRHAQLGLLDFGMMYAMSAAIDEPITAWEEMFLPGELERQVKRLKYKDASGQERSLAGEERVVATSQFRSPTPDEPPTLWPWLLLFALVTVAVTGLLTWRHVKQPERRRWRILLGLYHAGVSFGMGFAGCLLMFMWFGTDHTVTFHNENLFWTSPLTLLPMLAGLMLAWGSPRAPRLLFGAWALCLGVALLGQPLKLFAAFSQDTSLTVLLCAPLLVGMTLLARHVQQQRQGAGSGS